MRNFIRKIQRGNTLWVRSKINVRTVCDCSLYCTISALGRRKNAFEKSFAIPLMPSDLDELTTDKVALFLLLPLDLFKKEFKSYLSEQKDGKLNVDDWLQALSDRSQVNLFNLAIGYQQLKMAAYQERWEEFEFYKDAMKSGEAVDFKDEYEEIFA